MILAELTKLLAPIAPIETGYFSEEAPETYIVLTPIMDDLTDYSDDLPENTAPEMRISLFTTSNYQTIIGRITVLLLENGCTITARQLADFDNDTKYYNYAIDVTKKYYFVKERL
jgi:hypothetical protein